MLRNSHRAWWQRIFQQDLAPAYVVARPAEARRCLDCHATYEARDRYCPSCHSLTPEWRFG